MFVQGRVVQNLFFFKNEVSNVSFLPYKGIFIKYNENSYFCERWIKYVERPV